MWYISSPQSTPGTTLRPLRPLRHHVSRDMTGAQLSWYSSASLSGFVMQTTAPLFKSTWDICHAAVYFINSLKTAFRVNNSKSMILDPTDTSSFSLNIFRRKVYIVLLYSRVMYSKVGKSWRTEHFWANRTRHDTLSWVHQFYMG